MELASERGRRIGAATVIAALAGLARRLVRAEERLPDARRMPDHLRRDIGLS